MVSPACVRVVPNYCSENRRRLRNGIPGFTICGRSHFFSEDVRDGPTEPPHSEGSPRFAPGVPLWPTSEGAIEGRGQVCDSPQAVHKDTYGREHRNHIQSRPEDARRQAI
jgi:hypothetical protein